MLDFKHSSIINASVEVVWKFHQRPDVIKLLIPPWQSIQVIRREGGFGIGAKTEFRLFLGPLSITWVARHTQTEEYQKANGNERLFHSGDYAKRSCFV